MPNTQEILSYNPFEFKYISFAKLTAKNHIPNSDISCIIQSILRNAKTIAHLILYKATDSTHSTYKSRQIITGQFL
jgi:hypothetical protein